MKTPVRFAAAIAAATLAPCAQADVIGIYADAAFWQYGSGLDFTQPNTSDQNFDFGSESSVMLSLALEHPIPLVPNIKVRHASLAGKKSDSLSGFSFGDNTYTGSVATDLSLTHTDLLAYYELLDNIVSVDVGLGIKLINGDIKVASTAVQDAEKVNLPVPMVYAAAGGKLPFTGFSASADLAGFKYNNNRVIDASAKVQYNFIDTALLDLGAFAGYRVVDVQIEDVKNTDVSGTFTGPFAGVAAHF